MIFPFPRRDQYKQEQLGLQFFALNVLSCFKFGKVDLCAYASQIGGEKTLISQFSSVHLACLLLQLNITAIVEFVKPSQPSKK